MFKKLWYYIRILLLLISLFLMAGCEAKTTVTSQGYNWDITIAGAKWAQAYDSDDKVELNVKVEADDANALPHTVYIRLDQNGEMTASSDDDGTAICKQAPDVLNQQCNVSMGGNTYLVTVRLTEVAESVSPESALLPIVQEAVSEPEEYDSGNGELACSVHPAPAVPDHWRPVGVKQVYVLFSQDGTNAYVNTITVSVGSDGRGLYEDMNDSTKNLTFGPGEFEQLLPNGATLRLYLGCDQQLYEPDLADNAHQTP